MLDYVKDWFMFAYLYSRIEFIEDPFLPGLIYFHLATIITAGTVMGLSMQTSRNINLLVNMEKVKSPHLRPLLRFLLFLLTPILPVIIILKTVALTVEKRRLVAEWRRNKDNSPCSMWIKYNQVNSKKA